MSGLLADRVAAWVADHPWSTLDQVALAVRGRRQSVKDILDSPAFSHGRGPRGATTYALAGSAVPAVPTDGEKPSRRVSQCDLIARVLADGEYHTAAEIHERCGFSRLNSRIAELRSRRGMTIECRHVAGAGHGSAAYEYRLVSLREPSVAGGATADGSLSGTPVGDLAVSSAAHIARGDLEPDAAQLTVYDALAAA